MSSRIIQTVLPLFTFIVLAVLSFFAPIEQIGGEWIPLIGGFGNTEILDNLFVLVPLLILSLSIIFVGVYFFILRVNAISFLHVITLFLLFIAANPYSMRFNAIYPAMACIIWFKFCLFNSQVFAGYLLLSAASLFYAPIIWLVPASVLILPLNGMPDPLRTSVKALSGSLLPHIYVLVFRWIRFDDADVYLYYFTQQATDISFPFNNLGIPDYFLLLVIIYVLFKALSFFAVKSPKGFMEYILKSEIFMMVISFVLFLLFGGNEQITLLSVTLMSVSVIFAYYFKNCEKVTRTNMEFLMLICALILCAVSHIIN